MRILSSAGVPVLGIQGDNVVPKDVVNVSHIVIPVSHEKFSAIEHYNNKDGSPAQIIADDTAERAVGVRVPLPADVNLIFVPRTLEVEQTTGMRPDHIVINWTAVQCAQVRDVVEACLGVGMVQTFMPNATNVVPELAPDVTVFELLSLHRLGVPYTIAGLKSEAKGLNHLAFEPLVENSDGYFAAVKTARDAFGASNTISPEDWAIYSQHCPQLGALSPEVIEYIKELGIEASVFPEPEFGFPEPFQKAIARTYHPYQGLTPPDVAYFQSFPPQLLQGKVELAGRYLMEGGVLQPRYGIISDQQSLGNKQQAAALLAIFALRQQQNMSA